MLQLIFGVGVLLPQSKSVYADEPKNGGGDTAGDDDNKNGDGGDDSGSGGGSPSTNFANQSEDLGDVQFPSKPARKLGRVLNQDEVKTAIARGSAATLPLLLAFLKNNYPGKVLDVKLRALDDNYIYDVKLLSNVIFLRTVTLDAKTLKKF